MNAILTYSSTLSTAIEAFIDQKAGSMDTSIAWNADFLSRLRSFASAGKLLRGSMVCFSYAAFSNKQPSKAVFQAAMCLELTHSALLMHDDVMDKDELRRGKPSIHHQYQSLAKKTKLADATNFGESMAICGGDMALFLAFELLAQTKLKPDVSTKLQLLFARELAKVCGGQMQDVYLETSSVFPDKPVIYDLMRAKTAGYSLGLPLAMGAILAGQHATTIRKLQSIGAAAGTIFQIRDDELGSLGTTANLGKPIGSDIKKGKKTLFHYYLFKYCENDDRIRLKNIFGNAKASLQDISYVQSLARSYGVPEHLNNEISHLRQKALKQIKQLSLNDQSKMEMNNLVDFCATRQS
jgi:geranylgeranyl pyrophosphate synthase